MDANSAALLDELQDRLLRMYPKMIRECVDQLSDEDIWWRPNAASNSVGNMVLHLAGNLNHYLGRGVVSSGYERDRPAEFDEEGPVSRQHLLEKLDEAMVVARQAFEQVDSDRLQEMADLGSESQPVGRLLIAVTTHFNGHVGQIIYVTKMLKEGVFSDELWRRVGGR
jgi:uncharacterized damage-inducible protein DinB